MGSVVCGCFGGECNKEATDSTDGGRGKPKEFERDFKGPIRGKARRPKDLLCLVLFLVFIILLAAIGIYAWANGEPRRIIYPTDSLGRLCGVSAGVEDKPNLFFFDLAKCASVVSVTEIVQGDFDASSIFTCPTPQVCVERCPNANEFGVRDNPVCVDGIDTTRFTNITAGVDLTNPVSLQTTGDRVIELLGLISEEKCAPYYILSAAIARRCVPTLVDLEQQVNDVFSLNSTEDLQTVANMIGIEDLLVEVNIESIVNGSFTQALLVQTRQFLFDVYQDLEVVWPALLVGLVVAMIISFIYIALLICIAGPIIWIGLLSALLLIFLIAAFSFYQFYCFQETTSVFNAIGTLDTTLLDFINSTNIESIANQACTATQPLRDIINTQLPWFEYQEYTWLAIGILGVIVLLILIILLIFLGKKIRISIAIVKEASKAVLGVPTAVVYPVFTWLLVSLVFIYWGVVAVFLVTSSEPSYAIIMNASIAAADRNFSSMGVVLNGTNCDPDVITDTIFVPDEFRMGENASISCQFDQFVTSNFLLGIQIYNLFGLFWLSNFVLALGECTLAGAFASWYWAFKKPKDVPTFALIGSFGRAILFHSGSLAFGALIVAIIQLLRAMLAYVQKKLKGKTGKVAQAFLCMLACCLWCFEKIIRYINRQAYIEIAIYGYDFCTASCQAVKLLLRNILTTAVKDRIVAFLLFLGKLAITAAVGTLAYFAFGGYIGLGEQLWGRPLNYYLIPVIFLVIASFVIASGFMSVYHMAVDTIFICALEDLERNNGRDRPYFMSKTLMKLLNAKNVKSDHPDGGDAVQMESLESVPDK